MEIKQLVEMLTDKDSNSACSAMNELLSLSAESDCVYPNLEYFFSLTEEKSSFVRNRMLLLIAANARWDTEGIVDRNIKIYLSHITDKSPITARQCIKGCLEIAMAKPELITEIIDALKSADASGYAESMRPLVEKDIDGTLEALY